MLILIADYPEWIISECPFGNFGNQHRNRMLIIYFGGLDIRDSLRLFDTLQCLWNHLLLGLKYRYSDLHRINRLYRLKRRFFRPRHPCLYSFWGIISWRTREKCSEGKHQELSYIVSFSNYDYRKTLLGNLIASLFCCSRRFPVRYLMEGLAPY